MRKILVTGFSGFVARHYLNFLYENDADVSVLGADIKGPTFDLEHYRERFPVSFQNVNLLDDAAVTQMILTFQPDQILHLAAFSSVTYSWKHPADCFTNNTRVFLTVVEAVRSLQEMPDREHRKTRILSVGSSEIYGDVDETKLPLTEDMTVHPLSPYAIARQSQENLAKVYAEHFDVDVILTRSFNHIGPGQDGRFVIPSFIARISDVKKSGATSGTIETGDVSIIRDFLDVRDVVRAYDGLLQNGTSGEIYNICKGEGISLADVIDEIAEIFGVSISSEVNPEFVRPDDNHKIVGSAEKIYRDIGWRAEISLRQTLEDMINE